MKGTISVHYTLWDPICLLYNYKSYLHYGIPYVYYTIIKVI